MFKGLCMMFDRRKSTGSAFSMHVLCTDTTRLTQSLPFLPNMPDRNDLMSFVVLKKPAFIQSKLLIILALIGVFMYC